jgi:hypothetical protein
MNHMSPITLGSLNDSYELKRDSCGRLIAIYQQISVKPSHWRTHRIENKLIWHVAKGTGQLNRHARIALIGEGFDNPEAELLTERERNPITVDCAGIDPRRNALVPMFNKVTGKHEFNLELYGVSPDDLALVPSPVITSLAVRYPDHYTPREII